MRGKLRIDSSFHRRIRLQRYMVRIQRRVGRQLARPVRVARNYLRSLAKLWKHPPIATLQIEVNERLTSTLARWLPQKGLIEISQAAARRSRELQREIVCHEAAHFVVCERCDQSVRPHGPEWGALVRAAGFNPRATVNRCGERGRRAWRPIRFRHICSVCHFTRAAKRRMSRWRCPECSALGLDGNLRVEQVSPQ
jgi:predicted SprT family Zn-dependent metalloprotease